MSPTEKGVVTHEIAVGKDFNNGSAILALPEDPTIPLFVPVQKKPGAAGDVFFERSNKGLAAESLQTARGTSNEQLWKSGEFVPPSPRLFPEWPARANLSQFDAWEALPKGEFFKECAGVKRSRNTWFCGHLGDKYDHLWRSLFRTCYEPLEVFSRPDVRLILDIGGSAGSFARALHSNYGDKKLVVTANRYIEDAHHLIFPLAQYAAARGFPTVMFDMHSFLPFADNTFDVIHSSWAYHDGFDRVTLFEFFRVLRPGGFLVLRAIAAARHTLDVVLAFGLEYGWVCTRKWCKFGGGESGTTDSSNYLWCQAPGYLG